MGELDVAQSGGRMHVDAPSASESIPGQMTEPAPQSTAGSFAPLGEADEAYNRVRGNEHSAKPVRRELHQKDRTERQRQVLARGRRQPQSGIRCGLECLVIDEAVYRGFEDYLGWMAKIMLDVGAHVGETLSIAMESRWGFDRIYSFEPAPQCWDALAAIADDRVQILRFGLWSGDETLVLHDPGCIGASLIEDKKLIGTTAEVVVKDAARWFEENLRADDEIVMKVNCEGAECDVLDHLLSSGQLAKVDELLVHFDVSKIPSHAHREAETRKRLDAAAVPYQAAERIFFGKNIQAKTINWLSWYQARGFARLKYSVGRRIEYAIRLRGHRLKGRFLKR